MLRRLSVVLLVLASLVVCDAVQAKPPKKCPKGQVRLTAKAPCAKPRAAATGTAIPVKLVRDARVRKLAGTKLYAKLRKARAAMAVKAVRRATTTVEGGEWEPAEFGGKPGRSRQRTELSDEGGTQRRVLLAETEMEVGGNGVQATLGVQEKTTWVTVSCPDADGVATADVEWTHVERTTAARGKERASSETRMSRRARVRVQVGDDAEIASATYAGTVDFETRATGQDTARYVINWDKAAPLPDGPKVDLGAALKADPAGFLAGTYRGPKGERLTQGEADGMITMRVAGQAMVEDDLRTVLIDMKDYWQSDGNCVDLVVDPKAATLADGQEATLTATARVVSDGSPMTGAMEVSPVHGSVSDEHPRMVGGGPVAVRYTMGGTADKTAVLFTVQSRRGRATESVDITRPHGWNVTFTATGSYDQTRTEVGDTDVTSMSLRWTTRYANVFFDGGSFNPMGQTDMEGSVLKTHGTLGTGRYSCTGVPYPPQATIVPSPPAADGSIVVTLTPFIAVVSHPDKEECEREGYGGTYGTISGLEHAEPYAARITVTRDMLARPEFVVPVTFGGAFPPNCGQGPTVECHDSGTMVGGVRFTRVS